MTDSLRNEIFSDAGGDIFANRELVDISHVPELKRIVGRDDEIRAIGSAIAPGTVGAPPESVTIYGKTGTGKSLVAKSTVREATIEAERNDATLAYAYIDCSDNSTEAKTSSAMARLVADHLDSDRDIPRVGFSGSHYRDMVWEMLDQYGVDSFIVILDEIDLLDDETLLQSLSRAKESGKTNANIGVISISNRVEYRSQLNERVDSSLQDREMVFDPYDAEQLRAILENREDAFQEGVLEDGVIPRVAALAAQEHGDARKAVDMLYEAGRIAERQGASTVTEDLVDEAKRRAEVNRFKTLIAGSTPHVKHVLRALALLTENEARDEFKTTEIYELYTRLVEQVGSDPLSQNRITRLLNEQAFLGITESEHTGDGRNSGGYVVHKLSRDPEVVIEATTEM